MKVRRRLLALAAAGVIAVALTGCGPVLGKPALRQTAAGTRVFDASDPDVLVEAGRYFLFGSSNNMKLPVREITTFNGSLSASQTDWANNPHEAMGTRPAWIDPAEWQIWAPSAMKIGTKFYLYFGGHRSGARDEANDQCIGRAVSTRAMGPYTPEASPLYCGLKKVDAAANTWGHGALDPEVFKAPDGKLYMTMALSRTKGNIGVIRLDSAGKPVSGGNTTPTILASQKWTWHDGTDDSTLRSDAFLENPSMVYEPKSKTYLLFYSAGQWYTNRYNTGFGRCTGPMGPCALQSTGPFLKGGATRSAPGGLTAFMGNGGILRAGYASWTKGHESQVGPVGEYSRQVTWAVISLGGSDPAAQTVRLTS